METVSCKPADMACGIDVSIVLTVYNQTATLPLVLSQLIQQNYKGTWEIILCDDGSDEDTLSTIRDLCSRTTAEVRYIWQQRQGARRARTRNHGLRAALGRVIVLVDGDLVVPPNFVARHAALHGSGCTAIYGSRRWLFLGDLAPELSAGSAAQHLFRQPDLTANLYSEEQFQRRYEATYPWIGCMGCNFSFIRPEQPILFDEAFLGWGAEDQEFAFRLQHNLGYSLHFESSLFGLHLERGKRADFVPVRPRSSADISRYLQNIVHFYRVHGSSDTAPAYNGLGYYMLDDACGVWQLATRPNFQSDHIHGLLSQAERWVNENGSAATKEHGHN
jgi:glycosyltransferase involved in cell wall biosynthesis